ncbi:Diphthamide biosynthesis protein 3 [Coemansia nantahalensis]|nr:Diphthamide biosynthesis protein 3 [Coemansia nantahalensis]
MPDRDFGAPAPSSGAGGDAADDGCAALSDSIAALAVSDDDGRSTAPAAAPAAASAAAAAAAKDGWEANVAVDDSGYYDHIEIEDMEFDEDSEVYHYPCPCGDRFEITLDMLRDGEDVATCPSCSLLIKVIYDASDLFSDDEDDGEILLDTTITVC